VHLRQRVAADRRDLGAGGVALGAAQRFERLGLHDHQADAVRDDVVQLARDPHALGDDEQPERVAPSSADRPGEHSIAQKTSTQRFGNQVTLLRWSAITNAAAATNTAAATASPNHAGSRGRKAMRAG
jgi:hypothetical protein